MGLLRPLALASSAVKPTMDSLQMMKGFYRLLKRRAFVEFADRGLLGISHIEFYAQSVFISHRFFKLGGQDKQTTFYQKLLRFGIIVCDGTHQVIQWEQRYQIIPRIYQVVDRVLGFLEFARIVPARNCALDAGWHSKLPQIDLYVSLGGLSLRSINAGIKRSPYKFIRVGVEGLSFYADWHGSPAMKRLSSVLKDLSYLAKAVEDIYKIWHEDPKSDNKSEKGVAIRIIQTLPFLIIPAGSLYRARCP